MKKKNKKQRIYETELGGCHVMVVEKDIELALRILRQKFKYSNKIEILRERKEYIKPSVTRRKEILSAIYSEQFRNKEI
jgi:small subunit ribosomal protein S21